MGEELWEEEVPETKSEKDSQVTMERQKSPIDFEPEEKRMLPSWKLVYGADLVFLVFEANLES